MGGIVVKPRARIFHGHDWVYNTEVRKVFGDPEPGDVVSLKDFKDRPLGSAIYNPASQIVARRFSRRKQDLDLDFFRRRLERAHAYRERLGVVAEPWIYRAVWSESDGLPGVVVDRYGEQWVFQTHTLAMDRRKELLVEALADTLGARVVVEKNDGPGRAAEGLSPCWAVHRGEARRERLWARGVPLTFDPAEGQKTGIYIDQLDNYAAVAAHAEGRRVLDCFTNQGGFALHCARAGAARVTGVDSSALAVALARENAEAGGWPAEFAEDNVFDRLKAAQAAGETYDLIILDPPSFARNRASLGEALKGYKEIHLRALRMLEPGGLLATFSCSHHVDRATHLAMVVDAAVDAKRGLRLREALRQRADHPALPALPETDYLHGCILEVIPAW
jgi:23S rRNA (cytosine1962-C5)-methyltransferase